MSSKKVEALLKEINSLIQGIDDEIKTFDQKWFNEDHEETYQEYIFFVKQFHFEVELELIATDWLPFVAQ